MIRYSRVPLCLKLLMPSPWQHPPALIQHCSTHTLPLSKETCLFSSSFHACYHGAVRFWIDRVVVENCLKFVNLSSIRSSTNRHASIRSSTNRRQSCYSSVICGDGHVIHSCQSGSAAIILTHIELQQIVRSETFYDCCWLPLSAESAEFFLKKSSSFHARFLSVLSFLFLAFSFRIFFHSTGRTVVSAIPFMNS